MRYQSPKRQEGLFMATMTGCGLIALLIGVATSQKKKHAVAEPSTRGAYR